MFKDIPLASERCKKYNEYKNKDSDTKNKKKDDMMFNHYKILLYRWTHANNASVQQEDITIPVIQNIDKSLYDEIQKTLESKGYFVKNNGLLFTVSQISKL